MFILIQGKFGLNLFCMNDCKTGIIIGQLLMNVRGLGLRKKVMSLTMNYKSAPKPNKFHTNSYL